MPFDCKYLLENCRFVATFGMFHIQNVVPEFLCWYNGMLEIWQKLHQVLLEASTQQEDIQERERRGRLSATCWLPWRLPPPSSISPCLHGLSPFVFFTLRDHSNDSDSFS